jgi:hypothetical protein
MGWTPSVEQNARDAVAFGLEELDIIDRDTAHRSTKLSQWRTAPRGCSLRGAWLEAST